MTAIDLAYRDKVGADPGCAASVEVELEPEAICALADQDDDRAALQLAERLAAWRSAIADQITCYRTLTLAGLEGRCHQGRSRDAVVAGRACELLQIDIIGHDGQVAEHG